MFVCKHQTNNYLYHLQMISFFVEWNRSELTGFPDSQEDQKMLRIQIKNIKRTHTKHNSGDRPDLLYTTITTTTTTTIKCMFINTQVFFANIFLSFDCDRISPFQYIKRRNINELTFDI